MTDYSCEEYPNCYKDYGDGVHCDSDKEWCIYCHHLIKKIKSNKPDDVNLIGYVSI